MPLLSMVESTPVLIPYFLAFFMYIGIFTNFPLYLQLTQELSDIEVVEIWAIISGVALFIGALTRMPAGLLSDRIGRVNGFLLAYTVYFVSVFLVLYFNNNFIYILAMGILRFGSNMVAMTGRSVVSTAIRDRGLKNGLLSSMTGLGSFVGPYSLGYVLDHYTPDTIFYVSLGIIFFDMCLFFITFHSVEGWLDKFPELDRDMKYGKVKPISNFNYWSAMTREGILEIFILFFLGGLIYGLIQSVYSIYGYNMLTLTTTIIGFITGIGSLTQTVAAPLAGRLYLFTRDEYMRIGSWVIFVGSGILASLSALGLVYYTLSFFLLNIAFAAYFTMEITRMSNLVGDNEFSLVFGIASSLVILASSIAGFVSPILYNIIPEANFFAALTTAIVGLVLIIVKTPAKL